MTQIQKERQAPAQLQSTGHSLQREDKGLGFSQEEKR